MLLRAETKLLTTNPARIGQRMTASDTWWHSYNCCHYASIL